jgi:60 kDa SS-A/Ro ribonucleoprotein
METVKNVFEEMFEDIVGPNQTLNSCGKVVYKLDDLARLKRFMFLGSENSTLYINKNDLTKENLICLENLLVQERYDDILNVIIEFKDRSFKKDYLLYVLARCCSIKLPQCTSDWGTDNIPKDFKADCFKLTSDICGIPTHLFLFIELYEAINKKLHGTTGWNSYMKRMVSNWYNSKSVKDLMYHITKYQNRNNWTHRDVLRLTHIKNSDIHYNNIYKYLAKGSDVLTKELTLFEKHFKPHHTLDMHYLNMYNITKEEAIKINNQIDIENSVAEHPLVYLLAFEKLKTEESLDTVLRLIKKYNFVREHIPTRWLNEHNVWEALLPGMPMTATLRNLNKMTSLGLFDEQNKTNLQLVTEKLSKESILRSKVHPLQILIAIKMYSQGRGELGKMVWTPNQKIVGALNDAFYYAFDNVKSTGKRYLLALDVSGSMSGATVCGINCLSAAEVSCAMAMVYDRVEQNVEMMAFSNTFVPVSVSASRRLDDNLNSMRNITFGATDCSLPMTWATERKKEYDCIIIFTDSETNFNKIQPSVALKRYRDTLNINTKLVVCGLSSNGFTLADPEDRDMLDICGFDTSTHDIINEFVNEF